jgi:hypothetical protein
MNEHRRSIARLRRLTQICRRAGLAPIVRLVLHAAAGGAGRLAGVLHDIHLVAVFERYESGDDFESVAALSPELDSILAPNTTNLELAGVVGGRAWYMFKTPQAYDCWRPKASRYRSGPRLYPRVRIIIADQAGVSVSLIARVVRELAFTFDLMPPQHAPRDVVVAGLRQ